MPLTRIAYIRVCNEENTIIPALLSIAPTVGHILILWANMDDRSIDLVRQWQPHIENTHTCKIHLLHYPHRIVRPHSVNDLRTVPPENRMDTYSNYGFDHIRGSFEGKVYAVGKLDADQVYLTEELDRAFAMVEGPDDCVAMRGHNTLVKDGRLMLFKPGPMNGVGRDNLICGSGNLSRFGVKAPYEYDLTPHPRMRDCPAPCWMHFMRTARYGNVIRPFRDEEVAPVNRYPELMEKYQKRILPLLQQAGSPYAELSTE